MRLRALAILLLAVTLAPLSLASAGDKAPWIHVEVIDHGEERARVSVNLPLSLVDVALEAAEDEIARESRVHLDGDITVEDLRKMWHELREAGDADFVTVEERDETVRIFRRGDRLHVEVLDNHDDEDRVNLEIPIRLVDTLLDSEGETLNLRGALAELQTLNEAGDVLTVRDGTSRVRIWID